MFFPCDTRLQGFKDHFTKKKEKKKVSKTYYALTILSYEMSKLNDINPNFTNCFKTVTLSNSKQYIIFVGLTEPSITRL